MPNNFTSHIDKWLILSESQTDFTTLFARAWITFNAWYCTNYSDTNDRNCIGLIKTDGNVIRSRLIALLSGSDKDSKSFRQNLGSLHELLERNPIPNADPNFRITFTNVQYRTNPKTHTLPVKRHRNLEFRAEKQSNSSYKLTVINRASAASETKYSYTHNSYNYQHFEFDLIHSTLSNTQKEIASQCFKEINPKLKENFLAPLKAVNVIQIGEFKFINDPDLISQAVIEILYLIRCKLFHGEILPTKENLSIYEPAYMILRFLLKSIE